LPEVLILFVFSKKLIGLIFNLKSLINRARNHCPWIKAIPCWQYLKIISGCIKNKNRLTKYVFSPVTPEKKIALIWILSFFHLLIFILQERILNNILVLLRNIKNDEMISTYPSYTEIADSQNVSIGGTSKNQVTKKKQKT